MSSVVQQDFVERFFKGAASGVIDDVRLFCKGEQDIQPFAQLTAILLFCVFKTSYKTGIIYIINNLCIQLILHVYYIGINSSIPNARTK